MNLQPVKSWKHRTLAHHACVFSQQPQTEQTDLCFEPGPIFLLFLGPFFRPLLATTFGTQNRETRQCVTSVWSKFWASKRVQKPEPKNDQKGEHAHGSFSEHFRFLFWSVYCNQIVSHGCGSHPPLTAMSFGLNCFFSVFRSCELWPRLINVQTHVHMFWIQSRFINVLIGICMLSLHA